eukprot:5348827-Prymnesium_polylepis.2
MLSGRASSERPPSTSTTVNVAIGHETSVRTWHARSRVGHVSPAQLCAPAGRHCALACTGERLHVEVAHCTDTQRAHVSRPAQSMCARARVPRVHRRARRPC